MKKLILTGFMLLLAFPGVAGNSLWKATSAHGTLYLQGSAHVLKAEHYPLHAAIEKAYTDSSTLILEVDMGEMLLPRAQQRITRMAMLESPATLSSVLKPDTYQNLSAAAADAGLTMTILEPFKPWFAVMTLTLVKMQQLGADESLGLDRHFYEKAKADGKKVIGLETVDFQLALFDTFSGENPDDFVNRSLAELKQLDEDLTELLEAWQAGDIQTLETMINKSFRDYPDLYEKFITARNKAWAEKLAIMAQDGASYMVVVGAGHLTGRDGVINLLRNQGFSIEQL